MIKKYWFEGTLLALVVLLVVALTLVIIRNIEYVDYSNEVKHLKNQVVEAYDKGYSDGENHAIIDFTEDIYEVLIENAVLKERLKNQPSNEEYTQQIIDDFELTIKLLQHYYENNITTHSFDDWIQINYPALYKRILNYY